MIILGDLSAPRTDDESEKCVSDVYSSRGCGGQMYRQTTLWNCIQYSSRNGSRIDATAAGAACL